jgi:transcriptional regulator with XRE-family HTH domain
MSFAARVDAAIRASGKTGEEIARALGVDPNTISRIRSGKEINPKLQLVIGIAREAGTRVAVLLGESIEISPEDEKELLHFRGWIDGKLMTIDARLEPNAEVRQSQAAPQIRTDRIADRPSRPQSPVESPFGEDVHLTLEARGVSMTEAGILPGDTLYVATARPRADASSSAIGKIVACRLGDDLFVKRLVLEHGRTVLLSAHPRYQPIRVDDAAERFEILGVVIGRTGRLVTEPDGVG